MRELVKYILCITAGYVLLLWVFCLPEDLFEEARYSTVVEDCHGNLLGARIADDGQWRFPVCDTLPQKFVTALIEFEDRRFYDHNGVSLRSLARALQQNVKNGRVVSGGSTISMQVIRLSRYYRQQHSSGRDRRTLWTKAVECFMATRLEVRYSKEEILRLYASHAPFGGNVVGVDAALWRYLGSDECEMSWAEAATLAVLQNSPSYITPWKNRQALLEKRNRLLVRLCNSGHISQDECDIAIEEPLLDHPCPMPQFAPHLVEWHNKVNHGKKTRTAVDLELQKQVDDITLRWSQELRLSGAHDLAAVIIDVKSGEIVAYCGNADMGYERSGKWVDIARAPRSSGSILKPLLYCAALKDGQILPQTLLSDVPTDFGGFAPKNFSGAFHGAVPADDAIAQSLNVPCVDMLREYGVLRFVELLQGCGLSTLKDTPSKYGLSLILGGAEVTLLEMTKAYADMAAWYQGVFENTCSENNRSNTENRGTHVDFAKGLKTVYSFPLSDKVALYHTFEAMRKVNRPDQLDWRRVSSVQNVAWKTGTSYGSRDAWAIGLTPDYAVGVWVGNADGGGTPNLTGARTAGPVMFDLVGLLPFSVWFERPCDTGDSENSSEEVIETVVSKSSVGEVVSVCRHSGYRAGRYCSDTEECLVPSAGAASRICPYCHPVHLSLDGKYQVADRSEPTVTRNMFSLPPTLEYYYRQVHPEYTPLPPMKVSLNQMAKKAAPMKFLYPSEGSVIKIPRQMDGTKGQLTCKVAHPDVSSEIFWHCDNSFIGVTQDIHSMSLDLEPGTHTVSAVDCSGNAVSVTFNVVG